ncbi:hypothetical protein [Alicyclobacillus sp. SO9]|uniref:hypothetical protein n=1 Tax=Alicyclobacillus sp. SO9 TaxID=2665646 RepID=UPI0018E8E900|nr:hypothetical protein [Alicyclobacillus sp. SO9]QQE80213.1 hypothetical protein GI364_07230 [Alicyclobacillus sp. SO9]
MPAFVWIGVNNCNTPQENAGVFIGQINNGGWDANMKFQAAKTGNFGFFSINNSLWNWMSDNMEFIDGVINDQDLKPTFDGNV